MKRRPILLISSMWVLSLVLVGTLTAQASQPAAPQLAASTAFTHQGQIKRNGALFTGTCDLRFSLWDDAANGAQQGATLTVNAITVENGVFAVQLDFGNQFKGDARWLETAVKCADDADFTTLPRQALTAVPYAISLLPGAVISGTGDLGLMINTPNGNALAAYGKSNGYATVYSSDGSPNGGYAVYGDSTAGVGVFGNSTQSYGLRGESSSSSAAGVIGVGKCINVGGNCVGGSANAPGVVGKAEASGVGVYGSSVSGTGIGGQSSTGIGVHGISTSWVGVWGSSNTSSGVNGQSTDWVGVWGQSTNSSGVHGTSTNWDGVHGEGGVGKSGVLGINLNANSIGVKGQANAAGSVGVWGESTSNTGVYGLSTSGNGVWGKSTSGYAMRAEGNATQSINSGGWVKAMVYVDPSLPAGQQIVRCFNSQLSGSTATTVPCGFTATGLSVGHWEIGFNFTASQSFATITTYGTFGGCGANQNYCPIIGQIEDLGGSIARVLMKYSNTGSPTNTPFMLILY